MWTAAPDPSVFPGDPKADPHACGTKLFTTRPAWWLLNKEDIYLSYINVPSIGLWVLFFKWLLLMIYQRWVLYTNELPKTPGFLLSCKEIISDLFLLLHFVEPNTAGNHSYHLGRPGASSSVSLSVVQMPHSLRISTGPQHHCSSQSRWAPVPPPDSSWWRPGHWRLLRRWPLSSSWVPVERCRDHFWDLPLLFTFGLMRNFALARMIAFPKYSRTPVSHQSTFWFFAKKQPNSRREPWDLWCESLAVPVINLHLKRLFRVCGGQVHPHKCTSMWKQNVWTILFSVSSLN